MNKYIITAILLMFFLFDNYRWQKSNSFAVSSFFNLEEGQTFRVKESIDLGGHTFQLPNGVTLIPDGGILKNGTIVGNSTRIKGEMPLFEHVKIEGKWVVPFITTDLFYDLNYENSLRDVIALTSPQIKNKVIIKPGRYMVSIPSSGGAAISLSSYTTVQLDGDIVLKPNDYQICYVILINGCENVVLSGAGSIVGDKLEHKGSDGEWGMGVQIVGSKNVDVLGIRIQDCWGDCIYIGKESCNIRISNCLVTNGRRQGISITSANKVQISNCTISNVSGTSPEFGIDIEPNRNQVVENVSISKVRIVDCSGGILLYGDAYNARVRNIKIKNCRIEGQIRKNPFSVSCAESIVLDGCVAKLDVPHALLLSNVKNIAIKKNFFSSSEETVIITKSSGIIESRNKYQQIVK